MAIFKESEFIDDELIQMFIDKLENNSIVLKNQIENLSDKNLYIDSLGELFRIFHSLKASSGFFESLEFLDIVKRVESVISILQKTPPPIDERILNWLFSVKGQFDIWLEDIDSKKDSLSKLKDELKDSITISNTEKKNPAEILKSLVILLIDSNPLNPILKKLQTGVKELYHCYSASDAIKFLKSKKPDIIILDLEIKDLDGIVLMERIKKSIFNVPIIIYTAKQSKVIERKVKLAGINAYLNKNLQENKFKVEILSLVHTYFTKKSIKITNGNIKNLIENLPHLPDTIFEIEKICADDESSVNDLIRIVKKDPVISANILKIAQSPYFGFSNVNTIDKAVSLFGKNTTKALSFAGVMYKNFDFDLSPYNLTPNKFSDVSQIRAKLMIKWYSKVSFYKLRILATSAYLGNLGQLIISARLKERKEVKEFQKLLLEKEIAKAELEIFNVTNEEVTSDILSYWNLETLLADSIRYSRNLNYSYDYVNDYAVANKIIFSLVDSLGNVKKEIPKEVQRLMLRNNLDISKLENALYSI